MPNIVAVVLRVKKTSIGFSNRWKQQEKHDSHVVFSLKSNCICFFVFFLHFDAFFKYDLDFRPEVSSREGHINGENWEDYMWSSYVTSTETMTISTPITRKNYYFSFFLPSTQQLVMRHHANGKTKLSLLYSEVYIMHTLWQAYIRFSKKENNQKRPIPPKNKK